MLRRENAKEENEAEKGDGKSVDEGIAISVR